MPTFFVGIVLIKKESSMVKIQNYKVKIIFFIFIIIEVLLFLYGMLFGMDDYMLSSFYAYFVAVLLGLPIPWFFMDFVLSSNMQLDGMEQTFEEDKKDLNAKIEYKEKRIKELEDALEGKIKGVKVRRTTNNIDLSLSPNTMKYVRMFMINSCLKRTDLEEQDLNISLKTVGELDRILKKIEEVNNGASEEDKIKFNPQQSEQSEQSEQS